MLDSFPSIIGARARHSHLLCSSAPPPSKMSPPIPGNDASLLRTGHEREKKRSGKGGLDTVAAQEKCFFALILLEFSTLPLPEDDSVALRGSTHLSSRTCPTFCYRWLDDDHQHYRTPPPLIVFYFATPVSTLSTTEPRFCRTIFDMYLCRGSNPKLVTLPDYWCTILIWTPRARRYPSRVVLRLLKSPPPPKKRMSLFV